MWRFFKAPSVLDREPLLSQGPVGLSTRPGQGVRGPLMALCPGAGCGDWYLRVTIALVISTCYFSAVFSDHNGGNKLQLPRKDELAWLPPQFGQRTLGWSLKG